MKIAVIGYSGSGKSTLARALAARCGADLLSLDRVHWLPGWRENAPEDELSQVRTFLDTHESWVIDGNYSRLEYARRMHEADLIIFLCFDRFSCLTRVMRRAARYRGRSRESMTEGCAEKLDPEFAKWILRDGRSPAHRARYSAVRRRYPEKVIVLRSQRELDAFYTNHHLS